VRIGTVSAAAAVGVVGVAVIAVRIVGVIVQIRGGVVVALVFVARVSSLARWRRAACATRCHHACCARGPRAPASPRGGLPSPSWRSTMLARIAPDAAGWR